MKRSVIPDERIKELLHSFLNIPAPELVAADERTVTIKLSKLDVPNLRKALVETSERIRGVAKRVGPAASPLVCQTAIVAADRMKLLAEVLAPADVHDRKEDPR